jgi:MFS transporter, BCD family, chlorophyll transporter
MTNAPLSWFGIARLGLVQAALGAVVVLTTSTLNRVMVVELALPAMLPGALVALHYAVQALRPRLGHGSDVGGRRTPWIVGGMAVLALGGAGAAVATVWMATFPLGGIVLAAVSFVMIGVGVGSCGTTLLVLLARGVSAKRRAAAATIVWIMMIFGFIVTTAVAGHLLDPFSPFRLIAVTATVSATAFLLTVLAICNIEGPVSQGTPGERPARDRRDKSFRMAMADVWAESRTRRFAMFVFISMLAYSAQDLILEPFAGSVFGFTPGETTKLSSIQHAGVLLGMVLVALARSTTAAPRFGSLQAWAAGGCIASAAALLSLATAAMVGPAWPLRTSVFVLGVTNGAFAVAAIASMMDLVSSGRTSREGVRMGLWGAAQAIAFGLGGFAGTAASDLARYLIDSASSAYALVFTGEAVLFLVAAILAFQVDMRGTRATPRLSSLGQLSAPRATGG